MFGPLWFAVVKEGTSGSVWLNRMQQRLKCVVCFRASSALTSRGWRVCGWAVWCRSAWSSRWSRESISSTTCWIKRSTHRRSAASSTTTSWRASAASAGSDHNRLIPNKTLTVYVPADAHQYYYKETDYRFLDQSITGPYFLKHYVIFICWWFVNKLSFMHNYI